MGSGYLSCYGYRIFRSAMGTYVILSMEKRRTRVKRVEEIGMGTRRWHDIHNNIAGDKLLAKASGAFFLLISSADKLSTFNNHSE